MGTRTMVLYIGGKLRYLIDRMINDARRIDATREKEIDAPRA